MRARNWTVALLSLAVAGGMALVGTAFGARAANSTATFTFTPSKVPKITYAKGKLSVHTHTTYSVSGTNTTRVQLNFDDDLKLNTGAAPKCAKASISGNITMGAANAACGSSLVGTGTAQANLASPGDVKGCVLAFNAQDGNPDVGGNQPGLLLFTRLGVGTAPPNCARSAWGNPTNGNTSILLQGALKGASGDFGKQLDVNHIPQGVPLSDFQVTVQKGTYVSARCNDADKQWNLRTKFTYTTGSPLTQTVNDSQACQVKQVAPPPPPPRPNTKITKSKIDSKRKQAKFWFKATGNATGFQCKLRGKGKKGGFRSCDSPKKYKRLKKGRYNFQVRAVGPGGKDASPAKDKFKIKKKHRRHHKHHGHHHKHHRHHHHRHVHGLG